MQIQIRTDCPNRNPGLYHSGCDYCQGGFIYEWVDLASTISEEMLAIIKRELNTPCKYQRDIVVDMLKNPPEVMAILTDDNDDWWASEAGRLFKERREYDG